MINNTIISIDSYEELMDIIMKYQVVKVCVLGNMFFIDELSEEFCPYGFLPDPNEDVWVMGGIRKAHYFMDVRDDFIYLDYY